MIEEAYCSFEVSKLLKDKGFDEPTLSYYKSNKVNYGALINRNGISDIVCRPTHQMALAWLRSKGIFITIGCNRGREDYSYCVMPMDIHLDQHTVANIPTYEQAEEQAIVWALNHHELMNIDLSPKT